MTDRPFGLQDEQFWSDPWATLEDVADARREERVSGIVIDAPSRVDVDAHEDVPVLAIWSGTNGDLVEAPFEAAAVLAVIDLDANVLLAGMALAPDVPRELPPGFGDEPGFAVENFGLELARATGVPWRPASLLVTAFLRDRASNRMPVKLVKGPAAYDDPAVAAFLAEELRKLPPRVVDPPLETKGVSYRRQPSSPEVPERGLALMAERVVLSVDGRRVLLRGSFRVPIRSCDVVRSIDGAVPDVGCPEALAVVPVHLLVIGSDVPAPVVVSLAVPVFEPPDPEGDALFATGWFSLDLAREPWFDGSPQTLFVRALSASEMSAPVAIALVSQEMLPGR